LFYDVIFVVAIAQVAHGLAKHPDASGVLEIALVFLPIAWLWVEPTVYTNRFETNDISHRVFTLAQMLPVVGIAVLHTKPLTKHPLDSLFDT
jgi:low temperature requirement protein LtrA